MVCCCLPWTSVRLLGSLQAGSGWKGGPVYNINELHEWSSSSSVPIIIMAVAGIICLLLYFGFCRWGLCLYLTSLLVWTLVLLAIYLIIFCCVSHYLMSLVLFLFFPGTLLNVLFGKMVYFQIFLGGGLVLLDSFPLGAAVSFNYYVINCR